MSDFWSSIQTQSFDNEAAVETRLILPLLRALGYQDSEIVPKEPVVFQKGSRKGRKHEADFVVYYGPIHNADTSLIVAEAKSPGKDLTDAKEQAETYAFATRAPFLLLTNGIQLEIWQFQIAMASQRILQLRVSSLLA